MVLGRGPRDRQLAAAERRKAYKAKIKAQRKKKDKHRRYKTEALERKVKEATDNLILNSQIQQQNPNVGFQTTTNRGSAGLTKCPTVGEVNVVQTVFERREGTVDDWGVGKITAVQRKQSIQNSGISSSQAKQVLGKLLPELEDLVIEPSSKHRVWTLDCNNLARYCPLDYGRVKTPPGALGTLDCLPVEVLTNIVTFMDIPTVVRFKSLSTFARDVVLSMLEHKTTFSLGPLDRLPDQIFAKIFNSITIDSVMSFRLVNKKAREKVDELRKFHDLVTKAPDVLRSIQSLKLGKLYTLLTLASTLRRRYCEICGDAAGYIYLLRNTRVCFLCFTHDMRFLPLFEPNLRDLGIPWESMKHLPHCTSIPGKYSQGKKRCCKTQLFDAVAAQRDAYWRRDRSAHSQPKEHNRKYLKQKIRLNELSDAWTRMDRGLKKGHSNDGYAFNPRRFMGVVRAPWFMRADSMASWGIHCVGCQNEGRSRSSGMHWRRLFTPATFAKHIEECGPVLSWTDGRLMFARHQNLNEPGEAERLLDADVRKRTGLSLKERARRVQTDVELEGPIGSTGSAGLNDNIDEEDGELERRRHALLQMIGVSDDD
ncbi:hypothetical protein P152DRAFT_251604 [Eremomyces bilateralis CBS 781.70]|uniref:F-box domain-containing protein n=1 Tax=Eremomyces bilateralis CBS 781.70 TaxID=1392243 RepID=A0A6G1FR32_9PEZI|nr:uncharacterized protein P152DRAFT_251604 [Eremomyces bilateralis CBS 781.70]KAF1808188.1 hypothetical protein P152DRAFT_251604 [Eremomyces bilateralis CBS 781.70]